MQISLLQYGGIFVAEAYFFVMDICLSHSDF